MGEFWKRKGEKNVLNYRTEKCVPYLSFPLLESTGLVKHGFSTKLGGVSQGKFSTMNFAFTRGDDPLCVMENYRRMAGALEVDMEAMVLSYQTHTANVRKVTGEDAGKGLLRERDYQDVDGLITNVPGITLVTLYADCVPLYFLDPVHKAVGLSHSGWKGTLKGIGKVTLSEMAKEYSTRPDQVLVCIGPSICKGCYEVGEEVAKEVRQVFEQRYWGELLEKNGNKEGKYFLDLWRGNELLLLEAGVKQENIQITDICTCCNSEYLFSHRKAGEARGNLGAFLQIL